MSLLMDGINNVYALTAQINGLKAADQAGIEDPARIRYSLEQNFNQMLNNLISSTNDDEEDEESNDYFSFFTTTNQASLQSLQAQGILKETDVQALLGNSSIINSLPDTSSTDYLNSLYNLGQVF
jgi:hypothetical protein